MKSVGENIKRFRRAKKLSQTELAKLCGWDSQSRISMYERDVREPALADLEKIGRQLGVTTFELISAEPGQTGDSRQEPSSKPTISSMMEALRPAIERASEETKLQIGALLSQYATSPDRGVEISRKIEALLQDADTRS